MTAEVLVWLRISCCVNARKQRNLLLKASGRVDLINLGEHVIGHQQPHLASFPPLTAVFVCAGNNSAKQQ